MCMCRVTCVSGLLKYKQICVLSCPAKVGLFARILRLMRASNYKKRKKKNHGRTLRIIINESLTSSSGTFHKSTIRRCT